MASKLLYHISDIMSPVQLCFKPCFSVSASLTTGGEIGTFATSWVPLKHKQCLEERKDKLKKLIQKPELSISAYDTAWVAMVPSQHCPQTPSFPHCVNWVLQNQCWDGSWRLPHQSSDLLKDVLQSTLACVLALKKWGIGDEQINKGVQFIELNISSAIDENILSPIGFDIIFPGMLQYASDVSLNLYIQQEMLNDLFQKRDVELKSLLEGRKVYLAYVSEGAVDTQDWEMIMKYQKKNGSLFNSPSTTAAALTRLQNSDCHEYLSSALKKFCNAVPAVHPLDRYGQLFVVDNLEKLGITRYFTEEINNVMDEIYRSWLQEEEEIVDDPATCALAFRLLRQNGYDVSSDPLVKFLEEDILSNLNDVQLKDINTILDLYRASEMVFHPDDWILEKFSIRSKRFLKQWLSSECLDVHGLSAQIQKQLCNLFPG
ncbi:hypothetical protein Leryth_023538 [Lithospermum erythrorhizon]|nr:hypothetical protein Leryth_023538 [Lithospermum erythrorhizon]